MLILSQRKGTCLSGLYILIYFDLKYCMLPFYYVVWQTLQYFTMKEKKKLHCWKTKYLVRRHWFASSVLVLVKRKEMVNWSIWCFKCTRTHILNEISSQYHGWELLLVLQNLPMTVPKKQVQTAGASAQKTSGTRCEPDDLQGYNFTLKNFNHSSYKGFF